MTGSRTGIESTFSAHSCRPPFDRSCTSRESWLLKVEGRDNTSKCTVFVDVTYKTGRSKGWEFVSNPPKR
jgi:hypothetical protein